MRLFSIIPYLLVVTAIYTSSFIAYGNSFKLSMFYDLSTLLVVFSGFVLTFTVFKIGDFFKALKITLSNKENTLEDLVFAKQVFSNIWKNIFSAGLFLFAFAGIVIFSNASLKAIGPSLAIILLNSLYLTVIKLFFITPLETSIEKRLILKKKA